MPDRSGSFDATAFYEALNATRESRGQNWKSVAKAAGVSASTLTRMAQGKRPDVDSLAALIAWSGLSADHYVRTPSRPKPPETLGAIATLLRGDKSLSKESASALNKIISAAYQQFRDDG
jgi:transcriptional regulator with XRE-family HTH domain